jgi:uncharacterized protein DUF5670
LTVEDGLVRYALCDLVRARANCTHSNRGIRPMLLTLAIVLVVLWALGFLAFHVTSGLIHLLLVIAAIIIIARLVTGRRPVV